MARRQILKIGDETLKKKSKVVEVFDDRLKLLVDDMFETMHKAPGAGLAAVQVGVLKRVFVVDTGKGDMLFINPEIIESSGKNKIKYEACLSVPGKYGEVDRPEKVKVKFQDLEGKWHEKTYSGYTCLAICHEYDHLDGILYCDKATKMYNDGEERK